MVEGFSFGGGGGVGCRVGGSICSDIYTVFFFSFWVDREREAGSACGVDLWGLR